MIRFVIAAVALVLAFGAGVTVATWKADAAMTKHLLADAKALAKAEAHVRELERAQAAAVQVSSGKAAVADQKIQAHARAVAQEIPAHVTPAIDARVCVPYGLVRVLDAAVLGVRPSDLQLPAGQSDDACSPVAASALAGSVAANYAAARQNAVQLDELIDFNQAQAAILNGETHEQSLH